MNLSNKNKNEIFPIESCLKESKHLIDYWKKCFILLLSIGMTLVLGVSLSSLVLKVDISDKTQFIMIPVALIFVPAILVDLYKTYKVSSILKEAYKQSGAKDTRAALSEGKLVLVIIIFSTTVLIALTFLNENFGSLVLIVPLLLKIRFNEVIKKLEGSKE